MNTNTIESVENLNPSSRVARGIFSAALIGFTMQSSVAPLGWLAVLPLLAIYPMFTAITGWCPLKTLFRTQSDNGTLSFTARVSLGVVGIAAIGSVYVVSGPLGYVAVLPILGVYPTFAAIVGEDPLTALFSQATEEEQYEETMQGEEEEEHHHHDYRHAA